MYKGGLRVVLHLKCILRHNRLSCPVADAGFPIGGRGPRRGGRGPPRRLHYENFVCQNERIWTP